MTDRGAPRKKAMKEPESWRVRYARVAPEAPRAQSAIDGYLERCGLGRSLLDLVLLRVSLLTGCADCMQMPSHDTLARGERVEQLLQLGAWEESPVFSSREPAALTWADDAGTRLEEGRVSAAVYARARSEFTEKELVDLTWAVTAINSWNRLSIAFRAPP